MATKVELKAKKDKIEKLQSLYPFIGYSYFINNGSQNVLVFQPILNTFKIPASCAETIVALIESKDFSP